MECPLSSKIERIMVGDLPEKDIFTKIDSAEVKKGTSSNAILQKRSANSLRVGYKRKKDIVDEKGQY